MRRNPRREKEIQENRNYNSKREMRLRLDNYKILIDYRLGDQIIKER
jgi:hypothetical protein